MLRILRLVIGLEVCRFFIPADERVRKLAEEFGHWAALRSKVMKR